MTMERLPRPLVLLAAACLALPLSCGSGEKPLATVSGERIEHEDVESLIELYKSRAEAREGEAEENGKEQVNHAQEVGALQVLVRREALEEKARELGVTVDEDAVEELADRLEGPESSRQESEGEAEEGEEAVREQIHETARAQLLYQALQRRVTRNVRVPRREVVAYYRSHRSSYPQSRALAGKLPPPSVEATIRRGLVATARDKAMARFVARVEREFAPKIDYSEGWSPEDVKR
ncbi:MAG: SurA N-terminal domain-containing protein [Actinomycetota bacterium]|nr:SurA N-terminal domain-containing protein [Actinomycetota bacterium]